MEDLVRNIHSSYVMDANDVAWDYYIEFHHIILSYLSPEEDMNIGDKIPLNVLSDLVDRAYPHLLDWAREKRSRLAYLVLALHIMFWGANMSEELKKYALEYSKWKYERHQLKNKKDRIERRKMLLDFRAKLLAYKDGQKINFPSKIYTEESRYPIKYKI